MKRKAEKMKIVECTFRDGGYHNSWDFEKKYIEKYLEAMSAIAVDYVELGFRGFGSSGFKGACAFTTDSFIESLERPRGLKLGVMVNAGELVQHDGGAVEAARQLFSPASKSPVSLVRIASHAHEFEKVLPATEWLHNQGYIVAVNLMQIADRTEEEIQRLASAATKFPLEVLYVGDSMGSLKPEQVGGIISTIRSVWDGPIGIHTHDNMGNALANSLRALDEGVSWVDSTVTGMGRGPGNTKTEYFVLELESYRDVSYNLTPLLKLISEYFLPMQQKYGWGTNTFYFLAGKYGIHPTFIQEMLTDSRYSEEDVLAVIEQLRHEGGKKFNLNTLEAARNFFSGEPVGSWKPSEILEGREVLVVGTGPSVIRHKEGLESFIRSKKPYVIALNAKSHLSPELIDIRTACHPVRILADKSAHMMLPQPLVMPVSMLSKNIMDSYLGKKLLDFGLSVRENTFVFADSHCVIPNSLVISYALAVASSGKASRVFLAGFDGYGADDPRTLEVDRLLALFQKNPSSPPLLAITPTQYRIPVGSVYSV